MPWPKTKYLTGNWGMENPLLKNHQRIVTAVHTLLDRKKLYGIKVLEIGCGSGELLGKLAQKGAEVHGIDFTKRLAELARAKGATVIECDATQVDSHYPAGHFDAVITSLLLEESIMTRRKASAIARKAAKLTKPGGVQIHLTVEPNLVLPAEFEKLGLQVVGNRFPLTGKAGNIGHMITLRKPQK